MTPPAPAIEAAAPAREPEPASRPSTEGERKEVTVLFADVKGYTAMSEKLDPEEVHEVLNACLSGLAEVVMKYEATVDKYMGDCIMALFGAPIAHENDPERAIRAAMEMQKFLAGFSEANLARTGVPLRMRIGINTGLVIAADVGHDLKKDYTVMGDAVNTAQRLESAAPVGGILVSEETYRRARKLFTFESQEPIQVKNKAEPLVTYVVTGVVSRPERLRGLDGLRAPMIGRDAELSVLADALHRAARGAPQVVSLSGEAGLGKSRLLAEFKDQCDGDDLILLEGQCLAHGSRMAYLPFIDLVRQAFGIIPGDDEATVSERIRRRIAQVDPNLTDWAPFYGNLLSLPADVASLSGLDPETRQRMTRQAIRLLLGALGEQRTLLVVVEDLHWIDSLSLALLDLLAADPPSPRFMLLAVHRSDYRTEWLKAESTVKVALQPLDVYQSLRLVGELLNEADLPREIKDLILTRSEGNPFFVEEVLRSLIDLGALVPDDRGWKVERAVTEIDVPASLKQVIAARIDHLPDAPKTALRCGSILGRRFPVRILERLARPRPALDGDLKRLEAGEFVVAEPIAVDLEYLFKHELIRDVAYGGMLHRRRRALHEQAGDAIEEQFAASIHEHYEELAHHYEIADHPSKALFYLLKSAQKSQGLYANADAIEFYKRSLRMFERLTPEEAEARAADRIDIDEGLGTIQHLLGELDDAQAHYQEGITLANRFPDDPEFIARGADLSRKLADIYEAKGEHDLAMETLHGAVASLDSHPDRHGELSRLHRSLAKMAYLHGEYPTAESEARMAVGQAEQSGNVLDRAGASNALGSILCTQVRHEEAAEQFEAAVELGLSVGDLRTVASAFHNMGIIAQEGGDCVQAKSSFERSLRIMEKIENRMGIASNLLNLGYTARMTGETAIAEEQMLCSLDLWRQMGVPGFESDVLERLGHLYLDTGRYQDAERAYFESQTIREGLNDREGLAVCLNRRAELNLLRSEYSMARPLLNEALSIREAINDDSGILQSWNYFVVLNVRTGNLAEAEQFAIRVMDRAKELQSNDQEAWGLCRMGQVSIELGKLEEAVAYLQDAYNIMKDNRNAIERVEVLAELSAAHLANGDVTEAEEEAKEALRLSELMSRPAYRAAARAVLGGVYWERGKLDEARETYRLALGEFETLGQAWEAARVRREWGRRESSGGDAAVGAELTAAAEETFRRIGVGTT